MQINHLCCQKKTQKNIESFYEVLVHIIMLDLDLIISGILIIRSEMNFNKEFSALFKDANLEI